MNRLKFERTNGNIPKTLVGKDHISALLCYIAAEDMPTGFSAENRIQVVSSIEKVAELGITDISEKWNIRNLHYQLSQIFRLNPGVTLYVGLFDVPVGSYTFSEIKQMQNFASGDIRQIGVWNGSATLTAADLTALQGVASALEAEDMPLSIVYAPKVITPIQMPKGLAGEGKKNVSVLIGQDGAGIAKTLHDDTAGSSTVSGIGIVIGLLSAASVHESISWVKKFPTGVSLPTFGDGTLYRSVDNGVIEALDNDRYLFFITYSGLAGAYINDSHTMDTATSDYAYIELVRTMDKAVRGIRTYLLPEIGAPLKVDASTGKLDAITVAHLQEVASAAIAQMEAAGELSGYAVEINPAQNVLASSTVEIMIKQVPIGVMRKINVKIGFTNTIN